MSLYLYAVRCNFLGAPEREREWHRWYEGPKRRQMLALPQFLGMQRFRAAALDTRRKYLALWQVASPAAFETPEYRAQWGFAEWTSEIGDWSRDLYRAPEAAAAMLEIGSADALYFAAAEGLDDAPAQAASSRAALRRPGVIWAHSVGLDRHAPVLGLMRIEAGHAPAPLGEAGLVETVFAPLTECFRAAPGA